MFETQEAVVDEELKFDVNEKSDDNERKNHTRALDSIGNLSMHFNNIVQITQLYVYNTILRSFYKCGQS